MITRVDHIGIAVKNIDDALKLYTDVLGLKLDKIEIVEEQKVRTAIIPVGETKIELLESTDPDSAIARHIEKRGEGLHHLAFEVGDIRKAVETVKEHGVQLVNETPGKGVEGTSIVFLHPREAKADRKSVV